MNENAKRLCTMVMLIAGLCSCEVIDNDPEKHVTEEKDSTFISLSSVAEILSAVPIRRTHMEEVHDAVSSSSGNGYDEEYTMRKLFTDPGAGVGDEGTRVRTKSYKTPLKDLIAEHVYSMAATRSTDSIDPEKFLDVLTESDIQIYWPFSERWDGVQEPVITFDPEDGAEANIGYKIVYDDDGSRHVQEVIVNEEMAAERPVWVVNRNSDAGYTSLEMLRREDPDWGEGGGAIIVKPSGTRSYGADMDVSDAYPTAVTGVKTLLLKDFTMKRNYDSWFCGASEFFVLTITGGCSFA